MFLCGQEIKDKRMHGDGILIFWSFSFFFFRFFDACVSLLIVYTTNSLSYFPLYSFYISLDRILISRLLFTAFLFNEIRIVFLFRLLSLFHNQQKSPPRLCSKSSRTRSPRFSSSHIAHHPILTTVNNLLFSLSESIYCAQK